jgi:DNA-binding transcriptional ArsR family regulator
VIPDFVRISRGLLQRNLCKVTFAEVAEPIRLSEPGDVEALRAFVHPLRLRLLSLLRTDGPATASELARRVGESSGSTSYHLRQLARYGFVEDDPEQPGGRQRRWRATAPGTRIEAAAFSADPAAWALVGRLARGQLDRFADDLFAFLATATEWGQRWIDAATTNDAGMRMDADRLARFTEEVQEIIVRHRDETAGTTEGELVSIYFGAVPIRESS